MISSMYNLLQKIFINFKNLTRYKNFNKPFELRSNYNLDKYLFMKYFQKFIMRFLKTILDFDEKCSSNLILNMWLIAMLF